MFTSLHVCNTEMSRSPAYPTSEGKRASKHKKDLTKYSDQALNNNNSELKINMIKIR